MRILALVLACSFVLLPLGEAKSRAKSKGKVAKRTTRVSRPAVVRQSAPSQERYVEIQQALAERGYYEGPATGVWDASCVEALKKFQADQALKPDGRLGALSLIGLGLGPQRRPLSEFTAKPETSESN